ncbi:metal ABC transporter permease [Nocardioides sp. CPCC 205120]|uniref:metal ABC transporter permease n=1 Tax=Nocardioides sp. CPCC 205120 TaxID=3406462 RepID=UPI003B50E09E
MIDLLGYEFMQRALLAALFTGLAAPVIGTYLVQRRLSLMGDGIGHIAVTGVAIGLLTGWSPTWTAVLVAALGAMLLEVIRERGNTSGDLALALLFYGGLAAGVLITGLAGQSGARLQQYLFGSLTTISVADVWFTMALAVLVLVLGLGLRPQLFAIAQDRDFAVVAGLRVQAYNMLVAVLAAVTVTIAMRTVGLLLVSALMVVPVATSQQLARSFRGTLLLAMAFGAVAGVGGLLVSAELSFHATVAPGPAIVLVALAGFVLAWPTGALLRRRAEARRPDEDALADEAVAP